MLLYQRRAPIRFPRRLPQRAAHGTVNLGSPLMTCQQTFDIRLRLPETGPTREEIEAMARLHRLPLEEFVLRALVQHMADCQARLADPSFAVWIAVNSDLPPERIE